MAAAAGSFKDVNAAFVRPSVRRLTKKHFMTSGTLRFQSPDAGVNEAFIAARLSTVFDIDNVPPHPTPHSLHD